MQFKGSAFKAGWRNFVTCLMAVLTLGLLWSALPGAASADSNTTSYPAPQFEVRAGYSGGNYTSVKTFQRSDLEALANVQQAYTLIDNMPCTVIDSVGEGVRLTDILQACNIDVSKVNSFRFYTTDIPESANQPYETLPKSYLLDTPRYYFPNIADSWTTVDQSGTDPINGYPYDKQISFPDAVDAAAYAVQVPTVIAITDNWQREFSGNPLQPDFTTQDDSVRFRLVFGKTNDLASGPEHTASKSARWVYQMDVVLNGTAVNKVSLNETVANIAVGESMQLKVTVDPSNATDQRVAWSSDKPSVATVDATGKVTGLAAGTAKINATTKIGGVQDTCVVTVGSGGGSGGGGSSGVAVTGVSLNKATANIAIGGDDQLTVTVDPSNATDQRVAWSSDKPSVATVDATGKVTGLAMGTAKITATTESGGFQATCVVTVSVAPAVVGTAALTAPAAGQAYHPGDKVTISGTAHNLSALTITVNDPGGKTVYAASALDASSGSFTTGFTLAGDAAAGRYSIDITGTGLISAQTGTFVVTTGVSSGDFGDIQNHWAQKQIADLVDRGVLKGVNESEFMPDANVTRAQFTTMLAGILDLGSQQEANLAFTDIPVGAWYRDNVSAAVYAGLISGYGSGLFGPDDLITRQQMASMVVRALLTRQKATRPNESETAAILARFRDQSSISDWARSEVALAVQQGIVHGMTSDTFAPQAKATRAEAAVIIWGLAAQLQ
ncbi:MAG: Ig-like domain-containing protein [Thermacetogeniaceae bacterium]